MYPEDLSSCGCPPEPTNPPVTPPAPPRCDNGEPCAEIINTQCVRYDGPAIPGIAEQGDDLNVVTQNLAYKSVLEFVNVSEDITILPAHVGKEFIIDTATNGADLTVTIPSMNNTEFPVGGRVTFFWDQRESVEWAKFNAVAGAIVKARYSCDRLDALYAKAELVKVSYDSTTNETTWYLSGQLTD